MNPPELPTKRDCNQCGAKIGHHHTPGCDVERCMECGGQMISCGCWTELIYDPEDEDAEPEEREKPLPPEAERDVWSGIFPGVEQCHELGWFFYDKHFNKKIPDITRLVRCRWDKAKRRFNPELTP